MMMSGGENGSTALLDAGFDPTDGTNHLLTTYDSTTKDNQQIVFQHNESLKIKIWFRRHRQKSFNATHIVNK